MKEFYTTKMIKLLICTTTWRDPTDTVLSRRRQTQRNTYCMTHFYQVQEQVKQIEGNGSQKVLSRGQSDFLGRGKRRPSGVQEMFCVFN